MKFDVKKYILATDNKLKFKQYKHFINAVMEGCYIVSSKYKNLISPIFLWIEKCAFCKVRNVRYLATQICVWLYQILASNYEFIKENKKQAEFDMTKMLNSVFYSRIKDKAKDIRELVYQIFTINIGFLCTIDTETIANYIYTQMTDSIAKIRINSMILAKELLTKKNEKIYNELVDVLEEKKLKVEHMCLDSDKKVVTKSYDLLKVMIKNYGYHCNKEVIFSNLFSTNKQVKESVYEYIQAMELNDEVLDNELRHGVPPFKNTDLDMSEKILKIANLIEEQAKIFPINEVTKAILLLIDEKTPILYDFQSICECINNSKVPDATKVLLLKMIKYSLRMLYSKPEDHKCYKLYQAIIQLPFIENINKFIKTYKANDKILKATLSLGCAVNYSLIKNSEESSFVESIIRKSCDRFLESTDKQICTAAYNLMAKASISFPLQEDVKQDFSAILEQAYENIINNELEPSSIISAEKFALILPTIISDTIIKKHKILNTNLIQCMTQEKHEAAHIYRNILFHIFNKALSNADSGSKQAIDDYIEIRDTQLYSLQQCINKGKPEYSVECFCTLVDELLLANNDSIKSKEYYSEITNEALTSISDYITQKPVFFDCIEQIHPANCKNVNMNSLSVLKKCCQLILCSTKAFNSSMCIKVFALYGTAIKNDLLQPYIKQMLDCIKDKIPKECMKMYWDFVEGVIDYCYDYNFDLEDIKSDIEQKMKGKGLNIDAAKYYSITRCLEFIKIIYHFKALDELEFTAYFSFVNQMITNAFSSICKIPMLEIVKGIIPITVFSKQNIQTLLLHFVESAEKLSNTEKIPENLNNIMNEFRSFITEKYGKIRIKTKKSAIKKKAKLGNIEEKEENDENKSSMLDSILKSSKRKINNLTPIPKPKRSKLKEILKPTSYHKFKDILTTESK